MRRERIMVVFPLDELVEMMFAGLSGIPEDLEVTHVARTHVDRFDESPRYVGVELSSASFRADDTHTTAILGQIPRQKLKVYDEKYNEVKCNTFFKWLAYHIDGPNNRHLNSHFQRLAGEDDEPTNPES